MWRIVAPQRAVAHPFFMHEILAFSALHKAHVSSENRTQYYGYGIHHQDLAIRGVREKLRDVTPHDAAAVVATSTLLTLSVFASTGFELNYPEIPSSQTAIDGTSSSSCHQRFISRANVSRPSGPRSFAAHVGRSVAAIAGLDIVR
jgi:hypothetical protein